MMIDGARLRQLREDSGLSQVQLAQTASITKQYLSLLESGARRPSPPVVTRLAKALGVAVVDLRQDNT